MKRIRILNIDNVDDVYLMATNFIEIGRSQGCDIKVDEKYDSVSRKHGTISFKDNRLIYAHLGVNPAYLNNILVSEGCELMDDDILKLTLEGPTFKIDIEEQKKAMISMSKTTWLLLISILVSFFITIYILKNGF
jgi:hypothetical protein